ncbi:putative peptide n-glycanase [Corchorus olitorius]|uniref:Peptide n-glycanase n=1 Tax=Corchorus olitorius TaxID=93759 RepID=A0A1R3G8S2_9ROSI|nr:putative peptide n-glycanase [Corchorus olitorius]
MGMYEDLIYLESAWKTIPINNLAEKRLVSSAKDMIPQILEVIVVQDHSGVSTRENKE